MNRINIPIKATAKNRNAYNIRKKDHSLIHLTYFDASLRFTSTWTEISGTNNPWCNSPLGIQIISAISPFRDYGNWTKDRYLLNTSHSKPDMKDIWAAYLKQDFDAYYGLRHLAWNWLYISSCLYALCLTFVWILMKTISNTSKMITLTSITEVTTWSLKMWCSFRV